MSGLSVKPFLGEAGQAPGPELPALLAGQLLGPGSARVRALVREVRYAAGHHSDVAKLFDEFHSDAIRDYTRLIASWQEQGLAEPSLDPELVAQVLAAELLGLCHLELVNPPVDVSRVQPVIDAHLRALLTLQTGTPRKPRAARRPER